MVDDAAAIFVDDVYQNYYAANDDVHDDLVNSTNGELDYILYYLIPPISYSGAWTLIIYSTVVTLIGFITLFYAFLFIPKWYRYVSKICYRDGIKVDGIVLTGRRGRVFNPFRFIIWSIIFIGILKEGNIAAFVSDHLIMLGEIWKKQQLQI